MSGFSGIRYGEAMYAYATLLSRPGPAGRASAVRALSWLATQPHELPGPAGLPLQSVFENAAFAASYRIATARHAADPGRGRGAARVAAPGCPRSTTSGWSAAARYRDNKALVEAVAVLELLRTDVPERRAGDACSRTGATRAGGYAGCSTAACRPPRATSAPSARAGASSRSRTRRATRPPTRRSRRAYYVRALTLLPRGHARRPRGGPPRQMLRGLEVAMAPDGDLAVLGPLAGAGAGRSGSPRRRPRAPAAPGCCRGARRAGLVDAAVARLRARHLTARRAADDAAAAARRCGPLPPSAVDPVLHVPLVPEPHRDGGRSGRRATPAGCRAAAACRGPARDAPAARPGLVRDRPLAARLGRGALGARQRRPALRLRRRGRQAAPARRVVARPAAAAPADDVRRRLRRPGAADPRAAPAFPVAAVDLARRAARCGCGASTATRAGRLLRQPRGALRVHADARGVRMRVAARPGDTFQLSAFSRAPLGPGGTPGVYEQAGYAMVVRGASQRAVATPAATRPGWTPRSRAGSSRCASRAAATRSSSPTSRAARARSCGRSRRA